MEKIFNKDLYLNFKSEYSPDDFHHVAFKTTNYEEMVEFYKKLFGCEPLYQSNQITFLAFDDEHHRVAIANTSDGLSTTQILFVSLVESEQTPHKLLDVSILQFEHL